MRHRDACSYIDFSVTLHDREKLSESERERERERDRVCEAQRFPTCVFFDQFRASRYRLSNL